LKERKRSAVTGGVMSRGAIFDRIAGFFRISRI